MEQLLHKDITYDIRGACFAVWKVFGGAFKEKAAERALVIELHKAGRSVETQKKIGILYEGQNVGYYIPDIIVDDAVLVEIKSKEFLTTADYDQFWKYLKGSKYKVGLLINFGSKELEIKRVVYDSAREKVSAFFPRSNPRQSAEKGFTLMEIMVATVLFAIVFSSLLGLFNYVLKINRRTEAVRQASQGARDFVEFLVKEVRNGQIDYFVSNGQYSAAIGTSPCVPKGTVGHAVSPGDLATYGIKDNKLGLYNTDNIEECFYYGDAMGNYVDTVGGVPSTFSTSTAGTLVIQKSGESAQVLNPPNFSINRLMFLIRPLCDPYSLAPCTAYPSGYPNIQPSVVIIINFTVKLPTGESVQLYYQTAVSSNKYDIP